MKTVIAFIATIFLLANTVTAKVSVPISAKDVFGLQCDGSDESAKLIAAFSASLADEVAFPAGICAGQGVPTFQVPPIIRTAGMARTTFKNLSPTLPMFVFAKHEGANLNTSFLTFGGFTLDQNGSTGNGIFAPAQFSTLRDIVVKGQAGAGYAVTASGSTLGSLENVHVYQSSNCMMVIGFYIDLDHTSCERTTGLGVVLNATAEINIRSMYLDNGSVNTGVPAQEVLKVINANTVNITGLSTELATAQPLGPMQFMLFENAKNVNIKGGRISHVATNSQSKYLMFAVNSNLNISGMEWVEEAPAMIFAGTGASNKTLTMRDMVTNISTTGSSHMLGMWGGTAGRVILENWQHNGVVPTAYIDSNDVYCRQLSTPVVYFGSGTGRC